MWTPRALQDRENILEYWYQHNKSVAYPIKLKELFDATLNLLAERPFQGRHFDLKRNIRFVVIRDYKLYYTFDEATLVLLAIWDTRRSPEELNI